MIYFTYINHDLALKNSLHKAVYGFLKTEERKVVPEAQLQQYQQQIIDGIKQLNQSFNRCQPLTVHWHKAHREEDFWLSGVGFCRFNLYASKKEKH